MSTPRGPFHPADMGAPVVLVAARPCQAEAALVLLILCSLGCDTLASPGSVSWETELKSRGHGAG